MGLAFCKAVINAHDGEIGVRDKRSRRAASELGVEERGSGGEVGGHEVEVEEHKEGIEGKDLEEKESLGIFFKVLYKSCKGFH